MLDSNATATFAQTQGHKRARALNASGGTVYDAPKRHVVPTRRIGLIKPEDCLCIQLEPRQLRITQRALHLRNSRRWRHHGEQVGHDEHTTGDERCCRVLKLLRVDDGPTQLKAQALLLVLLARTRDW